VTKNLICYQTFSGPLSLQSKVSAKRFSSVSRYIVVEGRSVETDPFWPVGMVGVKEVIDAIGGVEASEAGDDVA
jgi:hypothetical protein